MLMKKIKDLNKYIQFMNRKTQYNKDVNFPQDDLQA